MNAISRLRLGRALTPAVGIGLAILATRPLGPLAGTMLLVVVLPPLALALDSLGWAAIVTRAIRRARMAPLDELLAAYGTWLLTSATLTLDVAAVVAVPVGLRLAHNGDPSMKRRQLGAAILGANVGSLLFPFSNLTNLLVVAATATPFGAYLALAWAPQIAAALAVGMLLWLRTRGAVAAIAPGVRGDWASAPDGRPTPPRQVTVVAGVVAACGAAAAVIVGLRGGDVAIVFALTTAIVAGLAMATEDGSELSQLVSSIPPAGVIVVLLAAVAVGPLGGVAHALPALPASWPPVLAFPVLMLVGGVLALTINNLPAAALGAVWLHGAYPAAIVAFLIGTNVLVLATPHGSLATILARRLGQGAGVSITPTSYIAAAWRYALVGAVAAVAVLVVWH